MKVEILFPKVGDDRWFQVVVMTKRGRTLYSHFRDGVNITNSRINPATGDCYRSTTRDARWGSGFYYVRCGRDKKRPAGTRELHNFRDMRHPNGRPLVSS